MVKEFNDSGPGQASLRLSDLFRTTRLIQRLGIPGVACVPEMRAVVFYDPRVRAEVVLTIEPWFDGGSGWYWYAHVSYPNGCDLGPVSRRRYVLHNPQPRQVVRAYQQIIRWELGRLPS